MRTVVLWTTLLLCVTSLAEAATRPIKDLRGHLSGIVDLDLHPDGNQVISISNEPGIFLWRIDTGRKVAVLTPTGKTIDQNTSRHSLSRRIEAIEFSPDGKFIAEAVVEGGKGILRIWDTEKRAIVRTLVRDARNVRTLAFSPDGKLLAANTRSGTGNDHVVVLVDVKNGKRIGELRGDRLSATMLCFSPDGKTLVTAGGRQLHVWDVESRKERHAISTHRKTILGIAFSPDNKHFASSDSDDEVRIWNAEDGKLVSEIEHKQDSVHSLAYSGTGNTVATGGKDGTIKLWSTKGKLRRTLWGHADRVTAIKFAEDNNNIVSGSRDGNISWWDFEEPETEEEEEDDPLDDEDWREMSFDEDSEE